MVLGGVFAVPHAVAPSPTSRELQVKLPQAIADAFRKPIDWAYRPVKGHSTATGDKVRAELVATLTYGFFEFSEPRFIISCKARPLDCRDYFGFAIKSDRDLARTQLGRPWFEIFGCPFYQPSAFFWWWFAYDAYARDIFVEGAYIAACGGIAAVVVAIAMSVWRAREAKRATTYGSARWAEAREVREAGLTGHDGALLGQWRDHYLRHDGPEHVLCFAPTRSGKRVGLVVPTLLTWSGSAIVHDIKGENWTLTAGWRARFGRVLLFDPTNAASAAYNPLLEVRRGEWEVRDVQNIADVLVDPEGALERRNHWEKTSHSLLVGAILHVLYAEPDTGRE